MQASTTPADPAARRHRPKTLTVFAAAFAAGAVLAYGVDRVVDIHVVQVEPQVESEPIFVALRSMPQGSPITVWDVALKDWPKAMLPTTALKADATFEGMVLRHPIREGQPLLSVQLARDGSALPGAAMAALPPVAQPVGGDAWTPARPAEATAGAGPSLAPPAAERFVPAAPADPPAAADTRPAPSAVVTQDAVESGPAPGPVSGDAVVSTLPVPVAVAASTTDIDVAPVATQAPVAAPEQLAAPEVVEIAQPLPAVVEPPAMAATPAPSPFAVAAAPAPVATPVATADAALAPLVAPVPALPTTDIERSLAAFGRPQPTGQSTSVLDRTTEDPAPTTTSTPRYHLVVPERIALAVDSSFTEQQPATGSGAEGVDAMPSSNAATQSPATVNRGPQAPAASNPAGTQAPGSRGSARKPAGAARQSATMKPATTKPASSKSAGSKSAGSRSAASTSASSRQDAQAAGTTPPASARGLGAWFPQFTGGSRQR